MVDKQLDEQIGLLFRYLNMAKGSLSHSNKGVTYFYEAILMAYGYDGDLDYICSKQIAMKHNITSSAVAGTMNTVYRKAKRTKRWEFNMLMEGYKDSSVWLMVQQMVRWLRRYVGTLQLNYVTGEYDVVWKRRGGSGRVNLNKLMNAALPALQIGDPNIINVAPHWGIPDIVDVFYRDGDVKQVSVQRRENSFSVLADVLWACMPGRSDGHNRLWIGWIG